MSVPDWLPVAGAGEALAIGSRVVAAGRSGAVTLASILEEPDRSPSDSDSSITAKCDHPEVAAKLR